MKNCTPLWREAHLEVKNAQNTTGADRFWKLRCWKSARRCGDVEKGARRCGAKHVSN